MHLWVTLKTETENIEMEIFWRKKNIVFIFSICMTPCKKKNIHLLDLGLYNRKMSMTFGKLLVFFFDTFILCICTNGTNVLMLIFLWSGCYHSTVGQLSHFPLTTEPVGAIVLSCVDCLTVTWACPVTGTDKGTSHQRLVWAPIHTFSFIIQANNIKYGNCLASYEEFAWFCDEYKSAAGTKLKSAVFG